MFGDKGEEMEVVARQGIRLRPDEYRPVTSGVHGPALWEPVLQRFILDPKHSDLGDFLASVRVDESGQVIMSLHRDGQEVLGESRAASPRSVPYGEIAGLERELEKLKNYAQTADVNPDMRTAAETLTLPDPMAVPDAYRLYGPFWRRRLGVIWGCQLKGGNGTVVPQIAPGQVRTRFSDGDLVTPLWRRWPTAAGLLLLALLIAVWLSWPQFIPSLGHRDQVAINETTGVSPPGGKERSPDAPTNALSGDNAPDSRPPVGGTASKNVASQDRSGDGTTPAMPPLQQPLAGDPNSSTPGLQPGREPTQPSTPNTQSDPRLGPPVPGRPSTSATLSGPAVPPPVSGQPSTPTTQSDPHARPPVPGQPSTSTTLSGPAVPPPVSGQPSTPTTQSDPHARPPVPGQPSTSTTQSDPRARPPVPGQPSTPNAVSGPDAPAGPDLTQGPGQKAETPGKADNPAPSPSIQSQSAPAPTGVRPFASLTPDNSLINPVPGNSPIQWEGGQNPTQVPLDPSSPPVAAPSDTSVRPSIVASRIVGLGIEEVQLEMLLSPAPEDAAHHSKWEVVGLPPGSRIVPSGLQATLKLPIRQQPYEISFSLPGWKQPYRFLLQTAASNSIHQVPGQQ
jgi:hypothetical protein